MKFKFLCLINALAAVFCILYWALAMGKFQLDLLSGLALLLGFSSIVVLGLLLGRVK